MLRTVQSLPLKGLLTLGFDLARYHTKPPACYRASWQLPGPVSHRLATTSFRLGHRFSIGDLLIAGRTPVKWCSSGAEVIAEQNGEADITELWLAHMERMWRSLAPELERPRVFHWSPAKPAA